MQQEVHSRVDEIDKKVGLALKSLRKMRGLNRKELADLLKISHQQIAKYENAENRISAGRLYMIATIFNVSVDYFFSQSVINNVSEVTYKDKDQLEVARNFANINCHKKREAVRIMAKLLAEETAKV